MSLKRDNDSSGTNRAAIIGGIFVVVVIIFSGIFLLINESRVNETGNPRFLPTTIPTVAQAPTQDLSSVIVNPTTTPSVSPQTTETITSEQRALLEHETGVAENGEMYGILDEKSVVFAPEGGIQYKDAFILSYAEVTYYDETSKTYKTGKVILDICTEYVGSYICYSTDLESVAIDGSVLPLSFVKPVRGDIFNLTSEKSPIVKVKFASSVPGTDDVFGQIFPKWDGTVQEVNIPAIGKVLTVRQVTQ